ELEALSRARLTGFLSLFHARIPAQQPLGFQRAPQFAIHLKKSTRNSEPRRASLPGRSAASRVNPKVVGIDELCRLERFQHYVLQWRGGKIVFKAATVDVDLARARRHANPRD